MTQKVLLLGAGEMALEYAKVLKHLGINFTVCCRTQNSADKFWSLANIKPQLFEDLKINSNNFTHAINAVSVPSLFGTNNWLITSGIQNILTEKPGAANFEEIAKLDYVNSTPTKIYVAYNRRHYS